MSYLYIGRIHFECGALHKLVVLLAVSVLLEILGSDDDYLIRESW